MQRSLPENCEHWIENKLFGITILDLKTNIIKCVMYHDPKGNIEIFTHILENARN